MIGPLNTTIGGPIAASQSFDQEAAKTAKAGANAVSSAKSNDAPVPVPKGQMVRVVVEMTRAEAILDSTARVLEPVTQQPGANVNILT